MINRYNLDEVLPLITATEIRDAYTQGHSQRVAGYAYHLACELELDKEICKRTYIAGLLHDIGKIGIPDSILLKPGKLDVEEYELIKLHSTISGKIVETIPKYKELSEIVAAHHENYDGSGYPNALAGEEIPIEARLLAIADVFDALTTRRVYRTSIELERSLQIIGDMGGKFDPNFLPVFISMIKKRGVIKEEVTTLHFERLEKLRNSFFFIDPLTKAFNRDGLLAILKKSAGYDYKVVLIFINIKNFREYNQLYGLRKGDEVLIELAKTFEKKLQMVTQMKEPRYKDMFFARIHADRFALLFIGQRADYLHHKMQIIAQEFEKRYALEVETKFVVKNEKLSANVEKELGYLL